MIFKIKKKINRCPVCNKKTKYIKAVRYPMLTPDNLGYSLYVKCPEHGWKNKKNPRWESIDGEWHRKELLKIKNVEWITE